MNIVVVNSLLLISLCFSLIETNIFLIKYCYADAFSVKVQMRNTITDTIKIHKPVTKTFLVTGL
jgi:hypothetical protein